jgi:PAS domain S-box-containing protein
VIGKVFLDVDIVTAESKAIMLENLKKRMKGLPIQPYEITFTAKNGEIRYTEVKAKKISYAGQPADLVIFRDITRRKRHLAKLKEYSEKMEALVNEKAREIRENAEKLRIIFDSSPDAITVLDLNGKIIDCNQAKVHMHGFLSKDELIGKNLLELVSPKDRQNALLCMREIVKTGSSKDIEYAFLAKNGKEFPVECASGLLKDAAGNPVGYISITKDITEKKLLQNKLRKYSEKLERLVAKRTEQLKQTQAKLLKAEKLAVIGELAGMLGHDLRNPLTGIKGAAYYLKTKYAAEIDATGKEMLETIDRAIDHSNKIVNDLLEYSRKLSIEFTETTPKLLLKNALALIEVPERIQIIDATKDKPEIKADIENMRKVFVNLITNAIDAMPRTGTLTITSEAVKGNVKIVFKDTGTGMTEETLSKLKLGFPLFTTKAKGMGFGLPICKRIVGAHGGKISLKSTLGKGTAVTVMIPVNTKPMKEGEEKWIFNASVLQAMRVAQKTP